MAVVTPLRWDADSLYVLDQRLLPHETKWLKCDSWEQVAESIKDMALRGAPAIGIAAAYGMALAARHGADRQAAFEGLAATRPTAVNLHWALNQMVNLSSFEADLTLKAAKQIHQEDSELCDKIAMHGASLLPDQATVLTICNTGALATGGVGTALGIIRRAFSTHRLKHVFSCETRPRLQGLKLTAWELKEEGIPFTSITDSMAATLMKSTQIDAVIVGADRIASNGDTANKIGTYSLACIAEKHGVPFYVAAPRSTFDLSLKSGSEIPIEERNAEEITEMDGVRVAPAGCPVWNPGFDVTPGEMITAIVDELGVHRAPFHFR